MPKCLALIGPLSSKGRPSGSTTRPISSGPTGICCTFPVNRTLAPALILFSSPKSTAPISFSCKLSAKAWTDSPSFPSISTTSFDPQERRPYIQAIPSALRVTTPTFSISGELLSSSMAFLMSSDSSLTEISLIKCPLLTLSS